MNLSINTMPSLFSLDTSRMLTKKNVLLAVGVSLLLALVFASGALQAGSGGTEFDPLWDTLKDWTQGALGKVIVGAMILVGIIGGIARQSIMAFALGLGSGVGLYYAPNIVENIMSATLPAATQATQVVHSLSNGLI